MSNGLASVEPDGPLYRLGRHPDPWVWPDWSYAAPDGTFGNRYDDPQGSYRVPLRVVSAARSVPRDARPFPA